MTFRVINNPNFKSAAGFSNAQFKQLDGLYLKSAAAKTLTYRSVSCDFEEGTATYSYYQSEGHAAYLTFIIRRVGPNTVMYEVWKQGKGRIKKSGVFEMAFEKIRCEIEALS